MSLLFFGMPDRCVTLSAVNAASVLNIVSTGFRVCGWQDSHGEERWCVVSQVADLTRRLRVDPGRPRRTEGRHAGRDARTVRQRPGALLDLSLIHI